MASNINSSGYFPPSPDVLRTIMANTGETANQKQAALGKQTEEHHDTFKHDSFKPHHAAPPMQQQEMVDLAEMTGSPQQQIKQDDKTGETREQNRDRHVAPDSRKTDGTRQVTSPKGVVQELQEEDQQRLTELDSQLHVALHLNSDLNPEQLAAARRVMESQKSKIEKNAKLKSDPQTDKAMLPELAPVPTQGTMDICEPGSDKFTPLQEDDYLEGG